VNDRTTSPWWRKLACPKGDLDLVFPNGLGKVESYANLIEHGFGPIQIAAGVITLVPATDDDGKPVINNAGEPVMREVGRYGLHALRHACASLWIEQGHNPKQIQTLMGHSSIKVTFDPYGHLFADSEADQRAAEGVEFRLLGAWTKNEPLGTIRVPRTIRDRMGKTDI
jgi:integrase